MPTNVRVVQRGGVWGPLILDTVAEPRPILRVVPVRPDLPPGLLPQGSVTQGRRILDGVSQADPPPRRPLVIYGPQALPPRGLVIETGRPTDEPPQAPGSTGLRAPRVVYGPQAPPPLGETIPFGRAIDEPPQAPGYAGLRASTVQYGPQAPPPQGLTLRVYRPIDEPPPVPRTPPQPRIIPGSWADPRFLPGQSIRIGRPIEDDGATPPDPEPATYGPDCDVFDDIVARLAALNRFADLGVDYGAPSEVLARSGKQYPCAAVLPLNWIEADRWDSGDSIRTVSYQVVLVVRHEEPRERYRQLDHLSRLVSNALNGQSLADITFKDLTVLTRGTYASTPQHPEQRLTLTGQFAYEIVGHDARDETDPT